MKNPYAYECVEIEGEIKLTFQKGFDANHKNIPDNVIKVMLQTIANDVFTSLCSDPEPVAHCTINPEDMDKPVNHDVKIIKSEETLTFPYWGEISIRLTDFVPGEAPSREYPGESPYFEDYRSEEDIVKMVTENLNKTVKDRLNSFLRVENGVTVSCSTEVLNCTSEESIIEDAIESMVAAAEAAREKAEELRTAANAEIEDDRGL